MSNCPICGAKKVLYEIYCEKCWQKYGKSINSYDAEKPAPEKSGMTRQQLSVKIAEYCDDIEQLFAIKNVDYGCDGDAFANFRKTAQRIVIPFIAKHGADIDEKEAMFLTALILQDKHLVALSQTGINGKDVAERLKDVAVYSLIMLAMVDGVTE